MITTIAPHTPSEASLQALSTHFLAYLDARPKTIETYARALRPLFAYLAAHQITRPTREDLLRFRDEIRLTHKAATVHSYLTAARLFFRWTQQQELYPNICDHIKGASVQKAHHKDHLTSKQVRMVLSGIDPHTVEGLRDQAMLALMTTCGLRAIEVSRALVADLRPLGDETALYLQGKGQDEKCDLVKIPPFVEQRLRAYLSARAALAPDAPLFASLSPRNFGGSLSTRSIGRVIKNRLVAVGLQSDRLSAHSLRHTAATLNLLSGGTLEETQQLLRHQNINTTMIYLHHLSRVENMSEYRIARALYGE